MNLLDPNISRIMLMWQKLKSEGVVNHISMRKVGQEMGVVVFFYRFIFTVARSLRGFTVPDVIQIDPPCGAGLSVLRKRGIIRE